MRLLPLPRRFRAAARLLTILALAALAVSGTLDGLLAALPVANVDAAAGRYLEATMARAAATFAVVRGLNGLISAIQGTALAVSPAGVGVTLAVGEVLDPINDLAEQFAWVMLASTTSLGIQRVLLEIGWRWGLTVLLPTALVIGLAGRFWPQPSQAWFCRQLGRRLLVLALVVRFGMALVAVASDGIYHLFLAERFQEATLRLERIREDIRATGQVPAEAPGDEEDAVAGGGWRQTLEEARNLLGIQGRIDAVRAHMGRLTEHAVNLIVVFILQTALIPLGVLWALTRLLTLPYPPPPTHPGVFPAPT